MSEGTSPIAKTTDFATGVVLAVYILVVVYQGNVKKLYNDLLSDYGYLEWLIAVVLLYGIYKTMNNKLVAGMIILAVTAALLKLTANNASVVSAFKDFRTGKSGLLQTLVSATPTKPLTRVSNTDTNTEHPLLTSA